MLAGTQGIDKRGDGTLILTGANTYTGNTTVSAGTLQIGNGGTTGSIAGNAVLDGKLVFNRSDDFTFSNRIDGSSQGSVEKIGSNTLTLTGSVVGPSQFTVTEGALQVEGATFGYANSPQIITNIVVGPNGVLTADATRQANYTTITGVVDLSPGGTARLFSGYWSYYVNYGVATSASSVLEAHLDAPNSNFMMILNNQSDPIRGKLNIIPQSGFGVGTYGLFTGDTQSIDPSQLSIGSAPLHNGYSFKALGYNQSSSGIPEVYLIISPGQWWNGSTTSGGTAVVGGTGTWDVSSGTNNWTDASGSIATSYAQNGFVIFGGTAGTVTVAAATATTSAPEITGMEFVTSGYTVSGGDILLKGANGETSGRIYVEDAAVTGGGTATIASALTGTMGLEKAGLGTLIFTGANTYSGGTNVAAGTLQIGDGGTSGAIVGNLVDNAAVIFNRSGSVTFGGAISGNGTLEQKGAGTLILTGASTFSGTTTVSAGTLQLSGGGSLAGAVNVASGGTLTGDPTARPRRRSATRFPSPATRPSVWYPAPRPWPSEAISRSRPGPRRR